MNQSTECPGCGSAPSDRDEYCAETLGDTTDLRACPHCSSQKCCMCDMGDDVGCIACNLDEHADLAG